MRQSQRGQVDPFIVMDVMEAASRAEAQGRRIVHMEVGQPSTPAPRAALDKLGQALSQPLGYTIPLGMPELRAAIAGLYRRWYGIELDPARVVVTPVSSNTGVEAGGRFDRVIRTRIGSPFVIAAMEAAGGDVVGYEANGGFLLGFAAQGPAGPLPPVGAVRAGRPPVQRGRDGLVVPVLRGAAARIGAGTPS